MLVPMVEAAIWYFISTEEFQRWLQATLYGIKGVAMVADDILVVRKGDVEAR